LGVGIVWPSARRRRKKFYKTGGKIHSWGKNRLSSQRLLNRKKSAKKGVNKNAKMPTKKRHMLKSSRKTDVGESTKKKTGSESATSKGTPVAKKTPKTARLP